MHVGKLQRLSSLRRCTTYLALPGSPTTYSCCLKFPQDGMNTEKYKIQTLLSGLRLTACHACLECMLDNKWLNVMAMHVGSDSRVACAKPQWLLQQ